MDALKALIKNVDDDYLIGISNKGTVKRAVKDLEAESPSLTWTDGEAAVALKEENCIIRAPLTDSACSCPSRSICRHIVTAILWLKRELEREDAVRENEGQNGQEPEGGSLQEESADGKPKADASGRIEAVSERAAEKGERFQEILDIPAEKLKRACKGSRYGKFLAHMRAGALPPVEESSVVTVTLPWDKAVVKLLLPFSGSSCTCHSRELCVHKAQAVLAYQLTKKAVTLEQLEALKEAETSFDEAQVARAAAAVCETLCQQMRIGLSRQSPEETESLERLAVIAHRAGLPTLESGLRALSGSYEQYFSRSAAFEGGELLQRILAVYRLARELSEAAGSPRVENTKGSGPKAAEAGETAQKSDKIRSLAGSFRDTYEPVGTLHLAAMGARSFSSKAGYAGEIYYFLETQQKRWYTWTDVRPTIYEGSSRKPPANSGGALAPWGLNVSRSELQKLEFDLQNAKAAPGGRLSVSQESKGEITGTRSLADEKNGRMIWWDFEKMLQEYFLRNTGYGGEQRQSPGGQGEENRDVTGGSGRKEYLALAGAVRWEKSVFDTVNQRFSWSVFDREGRELFISLKYTKEEKMTVQLLERMEKRLRGYPFEEIVFFGSLYLDEEGRFCLYPIEVFFGETTGNQGAFSASSGKTADTGQGGKDRSALSGSGGVSREILTSMKQYLQEAERSLLDVFYCGMDSFSEEILSGLLSLAEDGERLGLHQAASYFSRIAELLQGKRHRMEFSPEPVIETIEELSDYIRACREKLSYDMAANVMKNCNGAWKEPECRR